MLGLYYPLLLWRLHCLYVYMFVCMHMQAHYIICYTCMCNVYVICFSQNCLAFLMDLIECIQLFVMNDLILVPLSSILEAYRSGRGRVTVRGKTDVELLDSKTRRTAIIIKEVMILDSFVWFGIKHAHLLSLNCWSSSFIVVIEWNRSLIRPTNLPLWRR